MNKTSVFFVARRAEYYTDKLLNKMMFMFSKFLLYITNVCLVAGSFFNAALYKPAFMSSVLPGHAWTADKANDGYDNVDVFSGRCAHSGDDSPGWWMVDLKGIYRVEQIVLVNRGDQISPSMRTKNFTFDVFETDPRLSRDFPMEAGQVCYTRLEPVGPGETFIKNCTAPISGRFVRFIRYTYSALNICEIKVMVSSVSYNDNNFVLTKNSMIQGTPFLTLLTSTVDICTLMCLQRRDTDTCTAVNWVRTTNQCQMFKVNPRNTFALSADPNTDCYVES